MKRFGKIAVSPNPMASCLEELFGSDNDEDDVKAPRARRSPGAVSTTSSQRHTNDVLRRCDLFLKAKPEGDDEDEDEDDEEEDEEEDDDEEEEEEEEVGEEHEKEGTIMLDSVRSTHSLTPDFVWLNPPSACSCCASTDSAASTDLSSRVDSPLCLGATGAPHYHT